MPLDVFQLSTSLVGAVASGGMLGVYLTHKRLAPKISAEARVITASAMDKDWDRFHREIDRLVKRCEVAENDARLAVIGQRACEEREIPLLARIAKLEAIQAAQGEGRQRAAGIVALERLDPKPEQK